MEDNLSTKSSESSITTSGEYEIVNNSNLNTPTTTTTTNKSLSLAAGAVGSKSPTLDTNNRDISDIQHDMSDALREIDLDKNTSGKLKKS